MTQKQWICIGLFLATIVSMAPVCACDFITLDDPTYVTGNPQVLGGVTWSNLVWACTDSTSHSGFFYPLLWMSLQFDATVFGATGAWGFHLVNLLLHALSVVLFFLTLNRLTAELWRSAAAAALFAIHPLRVESVAWITERKDVLGMLFVVLTLAAYCWYAERPRWGRYAVLFVMFTMGLLAKVILITVPFVLLLLDYWPLGRFRLGQTIPPHRAATAPATWPRLIAEKIPLLLAAFAAAAVALHFITQAGGRSQETPLDVRVRVAISSYWYTLEKTFWPCNLTILYPWVEPANLQVILGLAAVFAVMLLALYWRFSEPAFLVGWLWFLGTLVPLSGVVHIGPQSWADRFAYLPHMGLAIAIVWGVGHLTIWKRMPLLIRIGLVAVVLLALGVVTWRQVWHWCNSETLFLHTLDVSESPLIRYSLGSYYDERGDFKKAAQHYRIAAELYPSAGHSLTYGFVLLELKNPAEAARIFQRGLRHQPDHPDLHSLLGVALADLGQPEEAKQHLQRAFQYHDRQRTYLQQDRLNIWRSKMRVKLGSLILREGNPSQALVEFDAALDFHPQQDLAFAWMGIARSRMGQWQTAEEMCRKALALNPDNALARGYLAQAYARQDRKQEAAREYAMILRQQPDWLPTTRNQALSLLTRTGFFDIPRARELAEQLCAATENKDAASLDVLAAVYAAERDFAGARKTAERALALTMDRTLADEIRRRLSLYEQGKSLPVE